MSEDFNFDGNGLAPREVPVAYQGQRYILREASEGSIATYQDAHMRAFVMNDGKVVGNSGASEAESLLVASCLCQTDQQGNIRQNRDGIPFTVKLETVRSWPHRVVKPLFEWVEKNSELAKDEPAEAIEKRIELDRARLAKLRANGNGEHTEAEGVAKNERGATTASSA